MMKKRRIVLVGQAPGKNGDGDPLAGRFGKKIACLMGIEYDDYLKFERTNVLDRYPGKCGKSDAFPIFVAKRRAAFVKKYLYGAMVIMFGRKVGEAFGVRAAYFERATVDGFEAFVAPHPSGVNRWWNDPENRERAKRFFRMLIEERR